jgi:hypothetical protein
MARYTLTRDDYFEACWFMQRRSRLRVALLAFIAAVLICAVFLADGKGWPLSLISGAVLFCTVVGLRFFMNKQKIHRIYDDNLANCGEVRFTIDEEGIESSHASAKAKVRWPDLRFFSENEKFILLFRGKDFAQIVLREALSELEEAIIIERVRNLKRI